MAILSGRFGTVKYDPLPASPVAPVEIVSINAWTLSIKTDYEEVTAFGDTNKVYVPGLRDLSGSFGGFWNSAELALVKATQATTPGYLELTPNSNESTVKFEGLAYMDAELNCSLAAPKISGSFKAAGTWVLPS